jgi:hypothetical protein
MNIPFNALLQFRLDLKIISTHPHRTLPKSYTVILTFWLFRVSCEGLFTTEAQSSQSSEFFLIKNSLLRAFALSHIEA